MSLVLVTGATGLIGSEFLRRLLAWDTDAEVALLVRPKGARSAGARVERLLEQMFPGAPSSASMASRVRVFEGELETDRLGLSDAQFNDLASSITSIFHFAADVRFDLPLEDARELQVHGTGRALGLARVAARRGHLERFHHISTFAAGRIEGASWIPEAPPVLDRGFRNTYEQSKAEAEALVLESAREVPVTIHRVGIVLGDSRTGWTSKFDTFYMLIRLLLEDPTILTGSFQIALPHALLNALPLDFVADALYALGHLRRGPSGEILHHTAGARATPLIEGVRLAARCYRQYMLRTGQPAPGEMDYRLVEQESPAAEDAPIGDLADEVMAMVQQLMPYAFDRAVYDNEKLLAALAGTPLIPPPIGSILQPIVEYPLRTGWGIRPEPRPPLGRPVV